MLPQLAVLSVSRGAQEAREVLLSAAFKSQVLHQIVSHLIRPAALMTTEGPIVPEIASMPA